MKTAGQFTTLPFVMGAVFLLAGTAAAANKVVVVPLGGTVGNAVASDVMKGKTFSSKAAGKGVAGTKEIREGSTIYTNSIGMKFSLIPAGSFIMGSPDGTGDATHRPVWPAETGRDLYERQHVVTLSKSFYMQTTEVTQGQWLEVMGGTNPSAFTTCGMNCPVEQVSWNDAQDFIAALNARENRTNCNTTPNTCYALPTESQWEYAARGGTVSAFYNGEITNTTCTPLDTNLDEIGWYCGNTSDTHPVAQKTANSWGLYDMSGNVREWCSDWFDHYPDGPVIDPSGGVSETARVIRGGGWGDDAGLARSASRAWYPPSNLFYDLGFRLALAPGQ